LFADNDEAGKKSDDGKVDKSFAKEFGYTVPDWKGAIGSG